MGHKIFVINPGSSTTKVALFEDLDIICEEEIVHEADDVKKFNHVFEQQEYRKEILLGYLRDNNYAVEDIDCFVGRGGFLRPCPSGTYPVCPEMIDDLKDFSIWGREHASNLGAMIAGSLAAIHDKPAFIVDPIVVDEMDEYARFSGFKPIKRKAIFHALNLRARSKRYAAHVGKLLEELTLIGTHMGGGISVALIKQGKFTDVTNAVLGNGPFTPQRCGALPMGDLIDLCFSGDYTDDAIKKMLTKDGGLRSYLDTGSVQKIKQMISDGDTYALQVVTAMVYHLSKYIGAMAAAANGNIDAIFFTGGIARDNEVVIPLLKEKLSWIAPIEVFPGEEELFALASGAFRVLNGEEKPRDYTAVRRIDS